MVLFVRYYIMNIIMIDHKKYETKTLPSAFNDNNTNFAVIMTTISTNIYRKSPTIDSPIIRTNPESLGWAAKPSIYDRRSNAYAI